MRIIGVLFFTWLLYQFSASKLIAQDYSWKNYSVADGLPQTQVVCMMQDSDGLLWLGTKNGFSIFDGLEFENYSSKDGLEFDHIYSFQEYPKGVFYISTTTGLNVMKEGRITPILRDLPQNNEFRLADAEGNFWYVSAQGLQLCDNGRFHTNHPVFGKLIEGEVFTDVLPDAENRTTWFYTNLGSLYERRGQDYVRTASGPAGLFMMKGKDGGIYLYDQCSLYHLGKDGFSLINREKQSIAYMLIKSPDDFFFSNYSVGNELWHYKQGRVEKFHHRFNLLSAVLEDKEGNLWLGTDSGLMRLMSDGFRNYLDDPEDNFYSWTVLQDRHGDYLFGSYRYKMKKLQGDRFTDIPLLPASGLDFYSIYSGGLKTSTGDLLISTATGVLNYNGEKFRWFYKPDLITSVLYIYDDRRHGKYLLATSATGLVETDHAGNAYVYNDRGSREHTELVTCVLRDKYDRIWISGKKGISIREDNRWRHLPDEKDSIPIGAISMLMDSAQNIWLGSNDGLYHYDYTTLRKIAPETFDRQIGVLNMTNDNRLLVGTINGMGLLDMEQFYRSDTIVLQFYNQHNGFLGVECKHNASFKDDDGNIWICTSNCVVKVIPQELKTNHHPPRVFIKSISATWAGKDQGQIHQFLGDTLALVFDSRQEDLRFNYHAISLSAPSGVKYRTMLEGYDTDWSADTKERYRTYTNLPNGQYTFKVLACNFDGVWTPQAAEANFTISPAWHELLSVKISGFFVAAAMAAGIGYLFSERKRKRRMADEQAEKNIAKLQFKSLKGMIDPHFTFNAINSIASMVYSQNRDEAYGYFTKFSRLIGNVFEHAEQTTRTLEEEIDFVTNYLDIEKMRFGNKFDYTVTTSPGLNMHMEIPKLLIQIYVENAVKHGLMALESGGKLEVMLGEQNKHLEIVIRDNGIGRRQSQKTKNGNNGLGKGTQIIQQYFDLLNRFNERKILAETTDLTDGNDQPAGTEVRITIPFDFKYTI